MSDYERNKGLLIPTGIDTENFTEEDFETYCENGFEVIDGEIYEVRWEVRKDQSCPEFADVTLNEDGSISFHTYHYNGGGHWTEVVKDELVRKSKEGE